jgi:hypothetical protein
VILHSHVKKFDFDILSMYERNEQLTLPLLKAPTNFLPVRHAAPHCPYLPCSNDIYRYIFIYIYISILCSFLIGEFHNTPKWRRLLFFQLKTMEGSRERFALFLETVAQKETFRRIAIVLPGLLTYILPDTCQSTVQCKFSTLLHMISSTRMIEQLSR